MTASHTSVPLPTLVRPKRKGPFHPFWVFTNEITVKPFLHEGTDLTPWVLVKNSPLDPTGGQLGICEKHSLVAIRIYHPLFAKAVSNLHGPTPPSLNEKKLVDIAKDLFLQLVKDKCCLLEVENGGDQAFRLCHGDADGFPGLVIDNYQDVLVVQSSTSSSDMFLKWVFPALKLAFPSKTIYERSVGQVRAMEKLPERVQWVAGHPRDIIHAQFQGLKLTFEPLHCQKTGLFLDQRMNLSEVKRLAQRLSCEKVLDICSYVGAWSVALAQVGASALTLIDQDPKALTFAEKNIRNVTQRATISLLEGDLFDHVSQLAQIVPSSFCCVIADPPAFAKSPSHVSKALIAYGRLAKKASQLVKPGGLLVLCSCSRSITPEEFEKAVFKNLQNPRNWKLLYVGRESPDHTVNVAMASAHYLKCYVLQRSMA